MFLKEEDLHQRLFMRLWRVMSHNQLRTMRLAGQLAKSDVPELFSKIHPFAQRPVTFLVKPTSLPNLPAGIRTQFFECLLVKGKTVRNAPKRIVVGRRSILRQENEPVFSTTLRPSCAPAEGTTMRVWLSYTNISI